MDQPRSALQRGGLVGLRPCAASSIKRIQRLRQFSCFGAVTVIDDQVPRAQRAQHRMRNGRASATRTQQHHAPHICIRQRTLKAPGPARAVGVVANQLAVAQDHCIDSAHGGRFVRQRVQQRQHRLLAGVGDVQAGEADGSRGRQQVGQQVRTGMRAVQVDQLVMKAQAVVQRLRFLHAGASATAEYPSRSTRTAPSVSQPCSLAALA